MATSARDSSIHAANYRRTFIADVFITFDETVAFYEPFCENIYDIFYVYAYGMTLAKLMVSTFYHSPSCYKCAGKVATLLFSKQAVLRMLLIIRFEFHARVKLTLG